MRSLNEAGPCDPTLKIKGGTAIGPPVSARENVHLDVLEIIAEHRISSGTKEQLAFSTGWVEFPLQQPSSNHVKIWMALCELDRASPGSGKREDKRGVHSNV
jgi:hypothetical protein